MGIKKKVSSILYFVFELITRWKKKPRRDGYTILLTLPSDLPQMAFLVLNYIRKEKFDNCKEIVVILDSAKDFGIKALIDKNYSFEIPLKVVNVNSLLSFICRLTKSPFKFHWSQIITGINNSSTQWVLLKGCNYYIYDSDFYEKYFKFASEDKKVVCGVKARKDVLGAPVGTYEMLINVKIKDDLKPIELLANEKDGIKYDNLLYMQKKLIRKHGKKSVGIYNRKYDFNHMSYIVSTYRNVINSKTKNDPNLRFFFLVLINELLKDSPWHDKKMISMDNYLRNYTAEIDSVYEKTIDDFPIEIMKVVKQNNLDIEKALTSIKKVKKIIRK